MLSYLSHVGALVVLAIGASLGVAFGTARHAASPPAEREISILADSLAKPALADAIAAFEQTHPGVVVRPRFAGSRVIGEWLRRGAQPDAVVMRSDEADAMGAVLADSTPAFRDHTAIIVSDAARARIHDAADLAASGVRLGVGRAGTVLSDLNESTVAKLTQAQPPGFRERLAANVAEEEHDTQRGALADAVAAGSIDAAIMLASDAVPGKSVRIELPAGVRIVQTEVAAVVQSTPNGELARELVTLLGSKRGAAIFRAHGHDPAD